MSEDGIDANGVSLDGKTFVKYLGGRRKQKFTVPDGVRQIGKQGMRYSMPYSGASSLARWQTPKASPPSRR